MMIEMEPEINSNDNLIKHKSNNSKKDPIILEEIEKEMLTEIPPNLLPYYYLRYHDDEEGLL